MTMSLVSSAPARGPLSEGHRAGPRPQRCPVNTAGSGKKTQRLGRSASTGQGTHPELWSSLLASTLQGRARLEPGCPAPQAAVTRSASL